jgi:hypothetical protein
MPTASGRCGGWRSGCWRGSAARGRSRLLRVGAGG